MGWVFTRTPLQALLAVGVVSFLCFHVKDLLFFCTRSTSITVPDHLSIDDVIRGDLNDDDHRAPVLYFPTSCRAQSRLVFVSCPLCSPQAVDMVFRRYGYLHDLPVALPVGPRAYLGWPSPLSAQHHVRPSLSDVRDGRGAYSLLSEPAVYNRSLMAGLMEEDAVFFTMIRHPLALLVSTLRAFRLLQAANRTLRNDDDGGGDSGRVNALQIYIRNLRKSDPAGALAADDGRTASAERPPPWPWCIPAGFSLTRNLMSHCLGMPSGFPQGRPDISSDVDAVWDYVHRTLNEDFLLVMLMEYVDESLVLLRRLMCWSFKDILNLGGSPEKRGVRDEGSLEEEEEGGLEDMVSELTQHDRNLHRQWSQADYVLYDHFNATFWEKVERQGDSFREDLVYFRYLQGQVRWFCREVTPYGESSMQFPESVVYPAFNVTSQDCRLMEAPLLDMLKARYLKRQATKSVHSSQNAFSSESLPLSC